MLKLVYFVPESHLETTKQALFEVGAGKTGNYDSCCWQVLGQGQFRPLAGSNPYLGVNGVVEQVAEYRVEIVCDDELIQKAITALITAHPYEEPAFDVIKLLEI